MFMFMAKKGNILQIYEVWVTLVARYLQLGPEAILFKISLSFK
jgi:hypothetical protein